MKLTIFGAAGRTGRHLVEQSLAQGHSVTALVRTPDKLAPHHKQLTVIQGDIRDPEKVSLAVTGAEGVISVLGPTDNQGEFVVSQGVNHILQAMSQHNVRRLLVSIGAGVRDPNDRPTAVHAFFGVLVKLLSRNAYEDMARVDRVVRASDVDWTIVRVPRLTDAPKTGKIRCGYVGKELGTQLSRGDLAEFMLSQLADSTYVRKAPAISN